MDHKQVKKLKILIAKSQKSASFFIENYCRIQHPSLGVIPFKLFNYQRKCLADFRTHRFNIFKKCRQSGISTLSSVYALWFALFHPHKTVLIVSKRDLDAKDFLNKTKLAYDHLPDWMRQIWKVTARNEHEIKFANGSLIRSLTSGKDTLRSNASSLNIIDEAAFMPHMETMWAGGWSTLQHGGSVIVISTTNGIGNWYWATWTGAQDGSNDFNPIEINWWDMDWSLEFNDPVSGKPVRIAPTDGIKECKAKEEIDKYGPYWSPWLEREYRGLESKGESHLFRQEVLAEFVGSGGTILSPAALRNVERMVSEAGDPMVTRDLVPYTHPITGDQEYLDFNGAEATEGLWVWGQPVSGTPSIIRDGRVVRPGRPGHTYVIGVDVATGKNNDYSTINVIDVDTMEQVAEYMGRVQPNIFCKMVDYVGRWYNNALVCVERTGIGEDLIQDLLDLAYPNLWRRTVQTASGVKRDRFHGFATTGPSKAILNKTLIENISEEEGKGYSIKSIRLWKQFQIYIRQRSRQGRDTEKTGAQEGKGNHDDLVISMALALMIVPDTIDDDPQSLMPIRRQMNDPQLHRMESDPYAVIDPNKSRNIVSHNDPRILMPFTGMELESQAFSADAELNKFTNQLSTRPRHVPVVKVRKKMI